MPVILIADKLLVLVSVWFVNLKTLCYFKSKRVFVIGLSHSSGFASTALPRWTHLQTPLGDLEIDTKSTIISCWRIPSHKIVYFNKWQNWRKWTQFGNAIPIFKNRDQERHQICSTDGRKFEKHERNHLTFASLFFGFRKLICFL